MAAISGPSFFISPVRDQDGKIVQYFASFVDLTRHKDEQIQSKMLIDELDHRVKNTLAMVQSIVWRASRTNSEPKMVLEAIESRLFAFSRSHDLLTRENWESAELVDLLNDALEPFGFAEGLAERIAMKGENIRFPPKAALALGIAFNELATNAVKCGAFSNAAGSILSDERSNTERMDPDVPDLPGEGWPTGRPAHTKRVRLSRDRARPGSRTRGCRASRLPVGL